MMPQLDGLELVEEVRKRETNTPPYLIMLTAKTSKTDIAEALNAGADDFLSKPFNHGELVARINVGRRILKMQDTLVAQTDELRQSLAQVKTLTGYIPICLYCKRVRDDKQYWQDVEHYVSTRTGALFSHGLCPDCFQVRFPGDDDDD